MKNGIFAKLSAIAVAVLTLAAIFSSCAVSTPEEIIGTVSLPDTYSIVYEVEEKNGVITTVGKTVDKNGNDTEVVIKGRHDPVVVPRAVPVVEAMAAICIVDLLFSAMLSQMKKIKAFWQ